MANLGTSIPSTDETDPNNNQQIQDPTREVSLQDSSSQNQTNPVQDPSHANQTPHQQTQTNRNVQT